MFVCCQRTQRVGRSTWRLRPSAAPPSGSPGHSRPAPVTAPPWASQSTTTSPREVRHPLSPSHPLSWSQPPSTSNPPTVGFSFHYYIPQGGTSPSHHPLSPSPGHSRPVPVTPPPWASASTTTSPREVRHPPTTLSAPPTTLSAPPTPLAPPTPSPGHSRPAPVTPPP